MFIYGKLCLGGEKVKTYTIKEASEILKYNAEYLRQKIKRKEIEAVKVGRKWILTEETIKEILKG